MPETSHTPTGNYPKPAPVHHLDLNAAAERLLGRIEDNRRQTESLARESGVSVILMAIPAGDSLAEHQAEGVVTIQVLSGAATLQTGDENLELRPGELIVFQPGVRHDLRATETSVVMLTIGGGNK